jgi:hypothetical protein
MSVASYEAGGRQGHLGIVMTNKEYFAIAVDVFPVPNNSGPSAAVVAGMMAAVLAEMTRHDYTGRLQKCIALITTSIKPLGS